ncbi:uncharacterized protein RSE6_11698 [Rhynchosporium secalis]|uniref:N-alkane-inducible cytochrome P450 n=1 Tax=Rhynchosporium secalis TaxID=38038 RepID=A0A1E1MNL2_RHYSE|nr:uncharacterized protein RSE6_11698 [Rhynchosporium secalis]
MGFECSVGPERYDGQFADLFVSCVGETEGYLAKLKREIVGLRGSFEDLKSVKYLQYTMNEVMKLHPIVPANGRICISDTTLPDGGNLLTGNPLCYVMYRRKDLYGEDAEEFKPGRWETLRPSWTYLPFNGGLKLCIGQQFALTEAVFTIVRLLQAFKGG